MSRVLRPSAMSRSTSRWHGLSVSGQHFEIGDRLRHRPRVEDRDTGGLEISHVARDHGHAMYQRRRRDKPVTNRARVRHMEPCAAFGDSGIDREDAAAEGGQDPIVQPRPKYRPLRRIAAFGQQDTDLQLVQGDNR